MTPLFSNPTDVSTPLSPERLGEVTEGDRAFERQLLRVFLEDMTQRFNRLSEALAAQDFAAIVLECHSIKGAAGNVGAYPLRTAAEIGEVAARAGQVEGFKTAFLAIQGEFVRLQNVVSVRLSP